MKTSTRSMLFLLLAISFTLPSFIYAQEYKDAKEIVFVLAPTDFKKEAKVQRAKEYNATLQETVEKYWEPNIDYKFMQEKAAYKYAKSAKGILIGEFETLQQLNGIRTETNFNVRDGKKRKKILSVRLPAYTFEKVDIIYAVMHSQFMYKNLAKFKKPSKDLPKIYGHILKEKTLLIADSKFSEKFTADDFKQIYPYKSKVVSDEEITAAITNKDEKHIVLYEAAEAGNVVETVYPYWNIYQPNDGVVITRHAGSPKGLSETDVNLFVKRTK